MKTETRIDIDDTHYMHILIGDFESEGGSSTAFHTIEDGIDFIARVVNVYKDGQVNTLDYKSVGYGREKILDCIIEKNGDSRTKWVPEEEWGHAFTDDSDGSVRLYASGTNYSSRFNWFCK